MGMLLLVLLAAVAALAQKTAMATPQVGRQNAPNAAAIERGGKQFVQSCGFCHGADATGARGPDLVRSTLVAHDVGGDLIGEVVRNGRPAKGMPPIPLSAGPIRDIAAFLHARASEALHSGTVPRTYPLRKLLTGNAQNGKEYFDGAGGCTACHSVMGDLAHVATRIPPIDLEARMLYPRRDVRRTVTVTLPSGEKVEGDLVHIDEFNVALRDSSGWYRSYSLGKVKAEVHDPLAAHRELLDKITQAEIHDLFAFLETLK